MPAQLIESETEHHLVLLDHRVTQLAVERRAFRVQTWSLDGSVELRIATRCAFVLPSGARRELDPLAPESLAPLLGIVGAAVHDLTVTRDGMLTLSLGERGELELASSGRDDAWLVAGGGMLEGLAYHAATGGRAPWE